MATSAEAGQPGVGQELDLRSDVPLPPAYKPPFDRLQVTANVDSDGFGVSTDIRVKGSLQRTTELLGLCLCTLLTVAVFAWVCQLSQVEGWRLIATSAAAGVTMLGAGAWYLSARPSNPSRKRKEGQ